MSRRHRRTDPACRRFLMPQTRLETWWFDRNRGRACPVCFGYKPRHAA